MIQNTTFQIKPSYDVTVQLFNTVESGVWGGDKRKDNYIKQIQKNSPVYTKQINLKITQGQKNHILWRHHAGVQWTRVMNLESKGKGRFQNRLYNIHKLALIMCGKSS